MSSSKHLGFAILVMLAVVALGGVLLAWPSYREAAEINRQAQALRRRGDNYGMQTEMIARLTAQLEEASRRVDTGHKDIPRSSDIAGLMRVLSLPVDGVNIREQAFNVGESKEAVAGMGLSTRVRPLTVDMEARFDAVFAMVRAAESMDRLLRVGSVNVVCQRTAADELQPFAKAVVVLEAVYDPAAGDEEP
jgi:Tfp pilus assembly protein PilO